MTANILCTLIVLGSLAQNVEVGTTTLNAAAQFDITSTPKGVLVPRMKSSQSLGISAPANELLVFNVVKN